MSEAKTLGELKKSGIAVLSVRDEMRKNLVQHLESGNRILPGIIGYNDTVIPEIENAILSGHHMVFLGERGQAKSRIETGGYTNVSGLKKDDQGVWRAKATKDGKSVDVSVDFQGNVVTR